MKAELIQTIPCGCALGEGILWDARLGAFLWTDIQGKSLHTYRLDTGDHTILPLKRRLASFALTPDPDTLLAAFDDRIRWLDRQTGTVRDTALAPAAPGTRFNDGRTDPAGRFWIGTMVEDTRVASPNAGILFCLDTDGVLAPVMSGIQISNGIAWAPDGEVMYFADSPRRTISASAYDLETGRRGASSPIFTTGEQAFPDGAVTSADGRYWSATWGAGYVRVLDGSGTEHGQIPTPASQPSCCAFGGADLSMLAVTSAREDLSAKSLEAEPDAGHVFLFQTDAIGLPSVPYAGPARG